MKINIKTIEGKNRVVSYTREHWKEWFRYFRAYYEVQEGEGRLKGYLPVSREYDRHGYTCWILPLAPFALMIVAFIRGFREFWYVLVDAIDKWPKYK